MQQHNTYCRMVIVLICVTLIAILLPVAQAADTAKPPTDKTVNNVFLETDLKAALQDVANETGVNIVTDPYVTGTVSMQFENTPLEQALTLLLLSGGFYYKKVGDNCYLVGTGLPDSPTFNQLSETASIPLIYLRPNDVRELGLSSHYEPYLKLDKQSNALIVTAPRPIIDRVSSDLALLDRRPAQILIEAVVTDISNSKGKEFKIDWSHATDTGDSLDTETISFEGLTLGYSNLGMREVLLSLRALLTNGKAQIRATPRVMALNGQQAEIFVGREEYFSILAGYSGPYTYNRLESIKSGINMKILPRITGTDEITLDFMPEVSDVIGKGEGGLPVINRRHVSTTLRVHDGETIVVGGLASDSLSVMDRKVPLLGDIPLVGFLFRSTETTKKRTEVTILLTPHILREGTTGPATPPPATAPK